MEVEEAILIFVEVVEHVEALGLADVVDHVVLQKLVDIVGRNLVQLHAVYALEGSPRFESMLLGQLLALFFHDFFVFRNGPQELEHFVTSCLCQHFASFSSKWLLILFYYFQRFTF